MSGPCGAEFLQGAQSTIHESEVVLCVLVVEVEPGARPGGSSGGVNPSGIMPRHSMLAFVGCLFK